MSKIDKISLPHSYSGYNVGVFPLEYIRDVGVIERGKVRLISREIIFQEFQPIRPRYLNVTDSLRQTDGQMDGRTTWLLAVKSQGNCGLPVMCYTAVAIVTK